MRTMQLALAGATAVGVLLLPAPADASRAARGTAGGSDEDALGSFWQITDTHVNMQYPLGCGDCTRGKCATFADYYCGSSPSLYTSAVSFMQKTSSGDERPPAFIAHTGDVPDVWNSQNGKNASFLHATNAWQAKQLAAAFPTTPCFFAFGNHDFAGSPGLSPGGTGCPYGPECEPHYSAMCKAWSRDMDAAALASCSKLGYYYVDGKVPGVRVVVLNTNYFNWEGGVDLGNELHSKTADAHLTWLQHALASAPAKVMILGHIPPASSIPASEEGYTGGKMPGTTAPGVQLWWQSHLERYNSIVAQTRGQVTFEVFGHIHVDTFYISRTGAGRPGEGRSPSGVLWVGLSLVASYPPKNGGVRRYSFHNSTKQPTDITQWYYDVNASNATGQLEWRESWTALKNLVQPSLKNNTATACPYSPLLQGNLCNGSAMIGSSGEPITTVGGCYKWCEADARCKFFSIAGAPLPWCIRYSGCVPSPIPDSKYLLSAQDECKIGAQSSENPIGIPYGYEFCCIHMFCTGQVHNICHETRSQQAVRHGGSIIGRGITQVHDGNERQPDGSHRVQKPSLWSCQSRGLPKLQQC